MDPLLAPSNHICRLRPGTSPLPCPSDEHATTISSHRPARLCRSGARRGAAQLTTLQSEQQAVRALLDKATSIGDILQIQGQLFTLQTQIQQLSGQQGTLADQTAYATISVEVTAPLAVASVSRPHHSVWSRAGHAAAANSAAVVRALVLSVGWSAPILVIAAVAGLPFAIRWRRRGGRLGWLGRRPAGIGSETT